MNLVKISCTIEEEILNNLDEFARFNSLDRSNALRFLLKRALKSNQFDYKTDFTNDKDDYSAFHLCKLSEEYKLEKEKEKEIEELKERGITEIEIEKIFVRRWMKKHGFIEIDGEIEKI